MHLRKGIKTYPYTYRLKLNILNNSGQMRFGALPLDHLFAVRQEILQQLLYNVMAAHGRFSTLQKNLLIGNK